MGSVADDVRRRDFLGALEQWSASSPCRPFENNPEIARVMNFVSMLRTDPIMNTRYLIISILTSCLFALGVGCRSSSEEQRALLGKWECTDLSKIEHVSQFAKLVLDFRSDREVVSYMVDRKRSEIRREVEAYHIRRDILQIGEGRTSYRFIAKGNTLSLTVIKSMAGDDVGKTLELRRNE